MFGRTLNTFTYRNAPLFKNFDKFVVSNALSSKTSIIAPTQHVNASNATSSYSTQTNKPFTITEKRIDELRTPHQPTSPHLTIYKFPLPAVMSIMHRATGICLGLGVAGLAGVTLFAPHDAIYYIEMLQTQYPALVYPAKFAVALPLTYHFCTGVRHIFWDETVKGITVPQVETSGKILLAVVAVLSTALTFISFK
ncbi:hypothetical protein RB653_002188 [Dictyostelium firmibasis]|uniref:Succinate dehydrogenase cytochrome b560 subunit, mitochondrial n=1 Tax=Dictyostelium firmibasis TaxID=79012 RepID=A0AAN7U884_9MYCE